MSSGTFFMSSVIVAGSFCLRQARMASFNPAFSLCLAVGFLSPELLDFLSSKLISFSMNVTSSGLFLTASMPSRMLQYSRLVVRRAEVLVVVIVSIPFSCYWVLPLIYLVEIGSFPLPYCTYIISYLNLKINVLLKNYLLILCKQFLTHFLMLSIAICDYLGFN